MNLNLITSNYKKKRKSNTRVFTSYNWKFIYDNALKYVFYTSLRGFKIFSMEAIIKLLW